MYKRMTVAAGRGDACFATSEEGNFILLVRENGRYVRRIVAPGGKVYGARQVGYGDAYFEYPQGSLTILGEEIVYESR